MKKSLLCIFLGCCLIATQIPFTGALASQRTSAPWQTAYQELLSDTSLVDSYIDISYERGYFSGWSYADSGFTFDKYFLYDVDQDGVPELFLQSSVDLIAVFTFDNSLTGLGFNSFDSINTETGEIIVHGHWHGSGGSGTDEWQIYSISHSPTSFEWQYIDKMPGRYSVYNVETGRYDDDEAAYYEIYNRSVIGATPISSFHLYDVHDFSGIDSTVTDKPQPADLRVQLTAQNFTVNGIAQQAEIYNINDSNYFKLRDIAMLLNGTGSQFSVGYDSKTQTISISTGAEYEPVGGELKTRDDMSATCAASSQIFIINGQPVNLTAYNIGGNNFFKLRELGETLGFDVDYNADTNTAIVTSR